MVEEVRRHFGYAVDPKDDKFKAMLEQKEKEEQKAEKSAKKAAKQEKILKRIQARAAEAGSGVEVPAGAAGAPPVKGEPKPETKAT